MQDFRVEFNPAKKKTNRYFLPVPSVVQQNLVGIFGLKNRSWFFSGCLFNILFSGVFLGCFPAFANPEVLFTFKGGGSIQVMRETQAAVQGRGSKSSYILRLCHEDLECDIVKTTDQPVRLDTLRSNESDAMVLLDIGFPKQVTEGETTFLFAGNTLYFSNKEDFYALQKVGSFAFNDINDVQGDILIYESKILVEPNDQKVPGYTIFFRNRTDVLQLAMDPPTLLHYKMPLAFTSHRDFIVTTVKGVVQVGYYAGPKNSYRDLRVLVPGEVHTHWKATKAIKDEWKHRFNSLANLAVTQGDGMNSKELDFSEDISVHIRAKADMIKAGTYDLTDYKGAQKTVPISTKGALSRALSVIPKQSKDELPTIPAGLLSADTVNSLIEGLKTGKSVLLIAPNGSAVDEHIGEIELRMANEDVSVEKLKGKRLELGPSVVDLIKGTGNVGTTQTNVDNYFITPSKKTPQPIFIIQNIDEWAGEGRYKSNDNDLFSMLAPDIRKKNVQFLATVTPDQMKSLPPLVHENFIPVQMPTGPLPKEADEALLQHIQFQYDLVLDAEGLAQLRRIAAIYDPNVVEPGRIFNLAERIQLRANPEENPNVQLSRAELIQHAQDIYQVPVYERSLKAGKATAEDLIPLLDSYQIDTDNNFAKAHLLVRPYVLGAPDFNKPRGGVLLFGKPGAGKTTFTSAFTKSLNGDKVDPVEIDMNRFTSGGTYHVEKFTEVIAQHLFENPNVVFCFNEIESAHEEIQLALLSMLEKPYIEAYVGNHSARRMRKVPTFRSWWFFTSNAGERFLPDEGIEATEDSLRRAILSELAKESGRRGTLVPALVSRLRIWPFYGIRSEKQLISVLSKHMAGKLKHFSEYNTNGTDYLLSRKMLQEWTENWVVSNGVFQPGLDTRVLSREVSDILSQAVVEANLERLIANEAVRETLEKEEDLKKFDAKEPEKTCALSLLNLDRAAELVKDPKRL